MRGFSLTDSFSGVQEKVSLEEQKQTFLTEIQTLQVEIEVSQYTWDAAVIITGIS